MHMFQGQVPYPNYLKPKIPTQLFAPQLIQATLNYHKQLNTCVYILTTYITNMFVHKCYEKIIDVAISISQRNTMFH